MSVILMAWGIRHVTIDKAIRAS